MHACTLLVPDLKSLSSFRAGGSACVRDSSVALNCGDPVTRHNAKITPRLNVLPDCKQHPLPQSSSRQPINLLICVIYLGYCDYRVTPQDVH